MSQVKALFIGTSNAGVAYYRMWTWVNASFRNRVGYFHMPWWDKSATEVCSWEADIQDVSYKHRILNELWEKGKQADVIIFQMLHFQSGLDLFVAMKQAFPNKPIVTENDDQMLNTPDYNPANASYQPGSEFRKVAIEQMKLSDAMIVSTPYLKDVYGDFCNNIHILTNSLDFRIWDNLKHRRNKGLVRIGWAGGASHEEDLRIIEPVVRKILEMHKDARFSFVHGVPHFLRGIDRVESVLQWARIDRYPQFLASRGLDIGIAPLVDNAFNRGKSNLRWLEYSGLKIPTVASKVGHFAETIKHMDTGLLADSEKEWIEYLDWLICDEKSRRKMGKAANSEVRKNFNVDTNIYTYAKALEDIATRGRVVKIPEEAVV